VSDGATPIDLIRRPSLGPGHAGGARPAVLLDGEYQDLISDRPADITNLQTVTATPPIDLARLALDPPTGPTPTVSASPSIGERRTLALAGATQRPTAAGIVPVGARSLDGFLKIERQTRGRVWSDVTVGSSTWGLPGAISPTPTRGTSPARRARRQATSTIRAPMRSSVSSVFATTPPRGSQLRPFGRWRVVHAGNRLPAADAL
jgi:hypothetical protein